MFVQILSGLSCITAGLVNNATIQLVASLIGKFGSSAAFAIVFLFTAELFPTSMRNSAVGLCSTLARLGGMINYRKIIISNYNSLLLNLQYIYRYFGSICSQFGNWSARNSIFDFWYRYPNWWNICLSIARNQREKIARQYSRSFEHGRCKNAKFWSRKWSMLYSSLEKIVNKHLLSILSLFYYSKRGTTP